MNESIYLNLSILEISKTVMYEFWYDHLLNQIIRTKQIFVIWI